MSFHQTCTKCYLKYVTNYCKHHILTISNKTTHICERSIVEIDGKKYIQVIFFETLDEKRCFLPWKTSGKPHGNLKFPKCLFVQWNIIYHSKKFTGRRTDFLLTLKWEMSTSFSPIEITYLRIPCISFQNYHLRSLLPVAMQKPRRLLF